MITYELTMACPPKGHDFLLIKRKSSCYQQDGILYYYCDHHKVGSMLREMQVTTRKPSVIILTALLTLLVVLFTGCGSEVAPTGVPPVAKTGTPVKLVFTTQPSEATAGLPLEPQPVIAAVDEQGNIVTSYLGLVMLTITEGSGVSGAHLFGGRRAGLVNGIVEFREVSIDKAGVGYTLTATCSNLLPATSQPFSVSPGAPYKLAFTVQPSRGIAGSPFTTPPEVTVQDNCGNTVADYEGSVTMALTYGSTQGEAVLSGTTTVRVVNGVARFTDLSINRTLPEYELTATAEGLIQANSDTFKISAASPAKLEFTVQPSGAEVGQPFAIQPKVAIEDIYGNVVTTSRASVTLSITQGTGTAGAILSGTKTLIAEGGLGGLAVFSDLSIDQAGSGYTLTATSTGLTSATSQAFDVVAP